MNIRKGWCLKMFYKVEQVKPLPNLQLYVRFTNGQAKQYDVNPLLEKWEPFRALTVTGLFNCVKVDSGGYGIVWNDDIDLSSNELWEHGQQFPDCREQERTEGKGSA